MAKLNYFALRVAVKKQKTPAPDDVPFEEGLKKLEAAELKIKKLQPNADGEDELVDDDSVEF